MELLPALEVGPPANFEDLLAAAQPRDPRSARESAQPQPESSSSSDQERKQTVTESSIEDTQTSTSVVQTQSSSSEGSLEIEATFELLAGCLVTRDYFACIVETLMWHRLEGETADFSRKAIGM